MKRVLADLHIHTALSPCASDEMTPSAIVAAARKKGLGIIAICDHNTAGNVWAVQQAARGKLAVLPGIEIETAEKAHVLGIFPSISAARAVSETVCATLGKADDAYYRKFGLQMVMDAAGKIVGSEPKMLAAASTFTLVETVSLIHRGGGLAIASHVDRSKQSVLSQFGLFPDDVGLDAIEVSPFCREKHQRDKFVAFGLPVITASDSHYLEDVGKVSVSLEIREPSFDEFRLALSGSAGRSCGSA